MFNWKRGNVVDESSVVHGARITADNVWMAKYLLSGNPDRMKVALNHYLVNRGSREEPLFVVIRQGEFTELNT